MALLLLLSAARAENLPCGQGFSERLFSQRLVKQWVRRQTRETFFVCCT
ncbi:hypothetical protein EMIT091MI3_30082 [Kosakonia quasisacchari]